MLVVRWVFSVSELQIVDEAFVLFEISHRGILPRITSSVNKPNLLKLLERKADVWAGCLIA